MKFLSFLLEKIITYLSNLNVTLLKYINNVNKVKILSIEHNINGRFLLFTITNTDLLDNHEVLKHIFNALKSNDEFNNFGNFKVIITTANINGVDSAFHPNVLINNTTTYQEYYNKIKDYIETTYGDYGYNVNVIDIFKVRV